MHVCMKVIHVLMHAPASEVNTCFRSNEATFSFGWVRLKAAVEMKGRVPAVIWKNKTRVQNGELCNKIPSASRLPSLPSLPGRSDSDRGPSVATPGPPDIKETPRKEVGT